MAPPQHEIWGLYGVAASRIKGVKAHPDASCNACGTVLKNAQPSSNMLIHVLKCDKIDEDSKARWLRYDSLRRHQKAARLMTPARPGRNDARSAPSISKRLFRSPQSSSPRTSSRKRARASVTSINQREEENFLRVAMGFIATGIPFRVIDDPHFRAMFDYKLPSRRQLSGRLLDMIFTREMDRIIALMCSVTEWALVTDGWSNVNGDSIINFVLLNPKFPPVFWKSINTKAEVHTGRYIADTILSTIIELEAVVGAGVVTAVVTDNAANMKNAWKLVRKEHRGIVCTGCTAHGMNLLMKDIFKIKFFMDVLEKAQKLARFIKARRGLWSRFRDMQKQLKKKGEKRRRLSLTVATRWYTHEKCIANVVQTRDVIAALFADRTFLKSYKGSDLGEATEIFIEEEFWQDASTAVDLIRPINSSLAAFERDDCSISLVYHQFEWLRTRDVYAKNIEECSKDLQQQVLSAIEKRQKKVWWKPLEIARMLDQTKCMDGHDAKSVINAASKLANKLGLVEEDKKDILHKQLQEFVLEKCSWKGEQRVNNIRFSPLNWWSLPANKYKLVQPIAKQLLSTPTSSASSERSWSIHGFIHTKLRNRLTPEQVNKLVFVYTNIARKSEVNHIMYQIFPDACDDSDSSDSGDDSEDDEGKVVGCGRPSLPATGARQSITSESGHATELSAPQEVNNSGDVFITPICRRRETLTCQTR